MGEARVIHLVAGGGLQGGWSVPARDLYEGIWFHGARAWAEMAGGPWFILSARHGLLTPEEIVAPYGDRLSGRSAAAMRAWVAQVIAQMETRLPEARRVVVLSERPLPDDLLGWLRGRYGRVETPLDGLDLRRQVLALTQGLPGPAAGASASDGPRLVSGAA